VWPEDQAWCLARAVDEEIEFTVGCSLDASQALDRTLPVLSDGCTTGNRHRCTATPQVKAAIAAGS
jgi:hypothetical protein